MRVSALIATLGAGLVAALLIPLPAVAGGWHGGHGGHFGHGHHGGHFGFEGHSGHGHSFGHDHEHGHGLGHDYHHAYEGHHGGHGLHFGYGGGHGDYGYSLSYGYGGHHHGYSLSYGYGGYAPYADSHAYPAYGYSGGYSPEIYRAPHVYSAPSQPLYREPAPVALDDRAGWRYLSGGDSEGALEVFAAQAAGHPRAGAPKVGYALSSALGGSHSRAIWAMRRAFRIDPYGASEVSLDSAARARLRELAGHYDTRRGYRDSDDAFMGATLHFLLGETPAARQAAERAVELGDHDPSVHNLLEMLPSRLEPAPAHAHSAHEPGYPDQLLLAVPDGERL